MRVVATSGIPKAEALNLEGIEDNAELKKITETSNNTWKDVRAYVASVTVMNTFIFKKNVKREDLKIHIENLESKIKDRNVPEKIMGRLRTMI